MRDQKKLGVGISYINLAFSTIINIFLTPMIISALGDDSYSIYKVMQAFAGPLIMFNLGVSTIVARAIVKYEASDEHNLRQKQNTIALAMLASAIMAVIVMIAGVIMCFLIPSIYGKNYSATQLNVGQRIFIIFVISTIFHILTDAFNGCAIGHERFAFNSSMALSKNVLRAVLILVAIKLKCNAEVLALIDCAVAVIVFTLSAGYGFFNLRERPKLTYINKRELLEMLSFSAAILMQAIINQVNNNADTMILGAMISEKAVITMYSSALIVYSAYNSLVSVMSSFFLPKATRLITKNASGDELTDFVIRPGRYQAMVAVAVVIGFALFGKNFIDIWIGTRYETAYYIVLLLIVPVTIPLVQNTIISILDAALKRIYRSFVLVIMAAINIVLSIILVKYIGFWGAAIGTFISLSVGHIILMNVYYAKTFDMKIGRMFYGIFKGILPVGIISGVICLPAAIFLKNTAALFIVKILIFTIVYSVLLWKFGLRNEEKNYIGGTFKKFGKFGSH